MGFIELVEDLSERTKAEEEIRFKTALLEAQSETSLDGILFVDTQGRAHPLNKRFGEMLSTPSEVLASQSDEDFVHCALGQVKNPADFLATTTRLYAHPEEKSHDQFEFKDGRVFDRYSSPLRGTTGEHYGRIWYFRDITAQTRRGGAAAKPRGASSDLQWNVRRASHRGHREEATRRGKPFDLHDAWILREGTPVLVSQ